MNDLKVGQLVQLTNDQGTLVSGLVEGTNAFYRNQYVDLDVKRVLTYAIQIEGVGSEFRDYEWTVIAVDGVKA
jgi:hypothetical protein